MFQHTTTSTPASADSGMKLASGAATSMNSSRNSGVHHAGQRAARAGADIGRGARDRAGDADAAEQRGGDVGDALRHQLHVVAMLAAGHAVGDLGRQQALDAAEQREGERRRQHLAAQCASVIAGSCGAGKPLGMPPKSAADGLDRQMQQPGRERGQRPPRSACPASSAATRRSSEDQRGRSRRRWRAPTGLSVGKRLRRARRASGTAGRARRRQRQPAEILELAGEDRDRDAAGEADRHRVRDVADQRAQPQQADQRQHHAGDATR